MDFVNIDEFYSDILPEVPGCSVYTVKDRVRAAAVDFCQRTGVSVETTVEMDLDADEAVVQIPVPGGNVRPWNVLWVKTTNGTVTPVDRRILAEGNVNWEGRSSSWPTAYVRLNPAEIQLIPTPDTTELEVMSMHCSYIPTATAEKLDAVLFEEYREAITCGALARLLSTSKEPWYDAREARERRDMFAMAINMARALADKDFQTGDQMIRMRPLA